MLFLKFLSAVTNGTLVEINYTGTELFFRPGSILGGSLEFDCGTDRCISYFLEPALLLAPFSKLAFKLRLTGLTSHVEDTSIDIIRTVHLKVLGMFGVLDGLELKILKRGSPPLGGGEVTLTCPVLSSLHNADLGDIGRIKRIRGISFTTRISPQSSNRLIESSRGLLNTFIPDIYIHSDSYKGEEAGLSPGFGISLVAESTTGSLLHADGIGQAGDTPEDLGQAVAKRLLREISGGGYISTSLHYFVFILMSMTVDHVNKVVISKIGENDREILESIKAFIGVAFKIKPAANDSNSCIVSCLGSGHINFSQRMQ